MLSGAAADNRQPFRFYGFEFNNIFIPSLLSPQKPEIAGTFNRHIQKDRPSQLNFAILCNLWQIVFPQSVPLNTHLKF